MGKLLLVLGPIHPHRAEQIRSHLKSLEREAPEVVEHVAELPSLVATQAIVASVIAQGPSIVVLTSSGYDRAAKAVCKATSGWEKPPRLVLISSDSLDLRNSVESGFVTIADGDFDGFVNLSNRSAFLSGLGLSAS